MPENKSITYYVPPEALPARSALEHGNFGQTGFDRVVLQPYTAPNDMSPLLEGRVIFLVAGWSRQRRQSSGRGSICWLSRGLRSPGSAGAICCLPESTL